MYMDFTNRALMREYQEFLAIQLPPTPSSTDITEEELRRLLKNIMEMLLYGIEFIYFFIYSTSTCTCIEKHTQEFSI